MGSVDKLDTCVDASTEANKTLSLERNLRPDLVWEEKEKCLERNLYVEALNWEELIIEIPARTRAFRQKHMKLG